MTPSERDSSAKRARSTSRARNSRPTTPLRPSSRSSFRESARESVSGEAPFPLNTFEPAFAELSDAMADLEANMMHFQLMHESLARFSESFASFLYGLNMNAFCVDFPEAPLLESFRRMKQLEEQGEKASGGEFDGETTFMTTDTSFVENPPTSSKPNPKFQTPTPSTRQSRVPAPSTRGAARGGRSGGGTRGGRPSGLARPRGRGVR
ncbi:DASH complex subunit Dam1-domain-containing protein [Lasiosphaeria miniovina]|uniref:DASH complex subunit DAM1 n=1 Tax=Lasiosphaeria miniovina TaxID=1954250 RepID=A0AA40DTT8_9PEZI|nr:DASH complex subunit Dam1-domain-containing protein [Lasiosphaeria miniovina]KAK0713136.1 DASH complex subunit Dam1-domain-containing protein [Lasiosphaeria miniovina]